MVTLRYPVSSRYYKTITWNTARKTTEDVPEGTPHEHRNHRRNRHGWRHSIDLSDTAALVDVVNSHDVTIVAVPGGRGTSAQPVIDAHRALIAAAPTGRLLVVGGAGSLEDGNGNRFVDGEGFPEDYKPEAKAFAQILDEYRASEGLNWTMLSPAFEIAPGERTGKYNTALDTPAGEFISAEDFAVALIDEAEESKHAGHRFTVAN